MVTNTCKGCGKCCSYITIQLDNPERKHDWDALFWYLYHEKVKVYIDHEDDWYVEFETRCKCLNEDNGCTIYNKRPIVCGEHNPKECENNGMKESPYKKVFTDVKELRKYLEENNINYQFRKRMK